MSVTEREVTARIACACGESPADVLEWIGRGSPAAERWHLITPIARPEVVAARARSVASGWPYLSDRRPEYLRGPQADAP